MNRSSTPARFFAAVLWLCLFGAFPLPAVGQTRPTQGDKRPVVAPSKDPMSEEQTDHWRKIAIYIAIGSGGAIVLVIIAKTIFKMVRPKPPVE